MRLPCARCGSIQESKDMTICVHWDEGETLGKFCPSCVKWVAQALGFWERDRS